MRHALYALALIATPVTAQTVKFATTGDVGNTASASAVEALVAKNIAPTDMILFLGDDCYDSSPNFATQVSKYAGWHSPGHMYSALGNHEVSDSCGGGSYAKNYFSYFSYFPGNKRYYTYRLGPVQFFVANSEEVIDGNSRTSKQAAWMRQQIAASTAPWKIAAFHRAAYSSGSAHGSTTQMQWGWQNWGIDAVFSGHNHVYERVVENPTANGGQGVVFWTCGLGGRDFDSFKTPLVSGSRAHFTGVYGACFVTATATSLKVEFKTTDGVTRDLAILTK